MIKKRITKPRTTRAQCLRLFWTPRTELSPARVAASLSINMANAYAVLSRLHREGLITTVERGLYKRLPV